MSRTIVLADEPLLLEVQQLAAAQGKALRAVVEEALRAHVAAHRDGPRFSFAAIGRSGQANATDGGVAAAVDPVAGWSPVRPVEPRPIR